MCCDDYKRNLMKRHSYPISKNKERVIRIDVLEPVQNECSRTYTCQRPRKHRGLRETAAPER